MSTERATCLRCGISREVKPERGVSDWCFDCTLVERDLAARGCGTNRGYHKHLREKSVPCGPCLAAQRAHQEQIRRKKGVPPMKKAQCGTNSGYGRHMNARENPCVFCREAHRTAQREYRERTRPQEVLVPDRLAA